MKIIGLDVGEKRIGVAKVDSDTKIALPVGFVEVDGTEWEQIAKIARLNSTNFFVLGLPRSNEGNETKQTLYVRRFATTLTSKIPGAKIRFQDESLTSVEAEDRLKKRQKKYQKGDIDAEAASIILQDFIEQFSRNKTQESSVAETTNVLKKSGDKIALNSKKASSKLKKITLFGIPIVVVLAVAAVIAGFKIHDNIVAERERQFAEAAAAMKAKTFNFTVLPGETVMDVRAKLLKVDRNGGDTDGETIPNYTASEVDAALGARYDYGFLKDAPSDAGVEGFLYPETYNFYGDASVSDIINKFLSGMNDVIQKNNLTERYSAQGLSIYEGVTLASIVQKESPSPEMPTVAQVFLSRMNAGMGLGSDVTVSYALDKIDPDRTTYVDNLAALSIDSCYNTRIYAGLPCGPISNPGLTALLSVAEPSDTDYLFFLTGDDGLMYYSYTESEHNQNARTHCKELCSISL